MRRPVVPSPRLGLTITNARKPRPPLFRRKRATALGAANGIAALMARDRRLRRVRFFPLARRGTRTAGGGGVRKQIGEVGVNAGHGFVNSAESLVALLEAGGQADQG